RACLDRAQLDLRARGGGRGPGALPHELAGPDAPRADEVVHRGGRCRPGLLGRRHRVLRRRPGPERPGPPACRGAHRPPPHSAPTKAFTVVGDVAQTSASGGPSAWAAALAPHVQDRPHVEDLTVNYRTPRRIMDLALQMAQAHRLPVTEVSSVRDGDRDPLLEQ